jgi:phospholipid/cholesterol/gamma-HCH transport system substrate-binding protein
MIARLATALVTLLVTGLVATACSAAEPLRPGEPRSGDTVFSVVFGNALNLPDGAPVKVGGLTVGNVTGIRAEDYRAHVDIALRDGRELPAGTRFRLRYTTALGELYVEATPAGDGPPIAAGDEVAGSQVTVAPTVEDTLASAGLLVNGGGLGHIQTIVSELNTALDGRVGVTKGLLTETDRFLAEALRSTREIDRVLHALSGASATLRRRERTVNRALTELRPAARILTENTDDLVRLLESTDRLAVTADGLVRRTREDLRTVVTQLGPVLEAVLGKEEEILAGLRDVNAFGRRIDRAVTTDYLNLYFLLHLDELLAEPAPPGEDDPGGPDVPDLPVPDLPDPSIPLVGR